ncbi:MAG TPA: hypothetical protein VE825_14535 [Terriglobales bacterium]|jgi:D-glycero-alpha-D-manno-heptose-7-phosphate kinase|nr:hypothetical protein [Terriglobales bacterium]
MLIVRSPVRISFGGGGTDLPPYFENYGGAVLSTAINKYTYAIVGKRTDGHIQIISSDIKAFEAWKDIRHRSPGGGPLEIPYAVLQALGREVAVDLFLASEIPPGTGLGLSATVCVSVLHALSAYLHLPASKYDLAEKAFHIASQVLGKPVGKQDEYAAAFGGLNFMTFHPDGSVDVEPVKAEREVLSLLQKRLMLWFTGASHDSWAILQEQAALTRDKSPEAVVSLRHLSDLAHQMRQALLEGNLREFALLLHQGWESKKRISGRISSAVIDRLYSLARERGALGGKIAGAGGGGFLLLYCEEENQAAVRDALAAEGVREMRFAFDSEGSRVLVNDPLIDQDENCASQWTFVAAAPAGRTGRPSR